MPDDDFFDDLLDRLSERTEHGLRTATDGWPWSEWVEEVRRLTRLFAPLAGSAIGLRFPPLPASYAWLAALSSLGCQVFLLDEQLTPERLGELCELEGIDQVVDPARVLDPGPVGGSSRARASRRSDRGRLTIFTSGSTGKPKAVHHDWRSLTRPVRQTDWASSQTWLLTYRPQLYAGLQVFAHCLVNGCSLVLPDSGMGVPELYELMHARRVTCISATPSYWRRLITLRGSARSDLPDLEQITLGGEVCDQPLLDSLHQLFPKARIVHIYATSELGRCFSVKDGRAGFPVRYLSEPTEDGVEMRVEEGELWVRSANAMIGMGSAPGESSRPAGEWIATGDLVERVGDRWFFVGRRTEVINVGGNKVHPLRIEQVVLEDPDVLEARAFARSSSLVGQMVACELMVRPGADGGEVCRRVGETCRQRLAPHERPRFLEVVAAIGLSDAGKKLRRLPDARG
jgi:acyl-coenzyme A synthetase/AMP-(fatty) acid ligase